MADPSSYRPAPGAIPTQPGVYRFSDEAGRVIYVGKAKNLRSRLSSYFADPATLHPRTFHMVASAASVDWTVVTTEVEALQLEYTWIKQFDPRFNIRYRDDKSYPELAVTMYEEYPRLQVMRGAHRKGVRYFGPFSHAWAIRETLDLLLRVFPARTCSAGVFKRATQMNRPCLLGYIDKCSAPCVGRISAADHRQIAQEFCDFLSGKADPMIKTLTKQMDQAALDLNFEHAAKLRDDIAALRLAAEQQAVVLGDGTDADVIGIASDDLIASVQVFHIRSGRIRGRRGWIVDLDSDAADAPDQDSRNGILVENLLMQFYTADDGEQAVVPRLILTPASPPDISRIVEHLSALRGGPVQVRVPRRGDKYALAETVRRNAAERLAQHQLKRASDLTARSAALTELGAALGMSGGPLRIECVDISHTQGTNVVASLVVFEDGLPKRNHYRQYIIRQAPGDDVASIAEVVRRRFTGTTPGEQQPGKFAYPPQLLVVDGAGAQAAAAAAALAELAVTDVAVCGLAKRLEEIYLPHRADPIILPRASEALYLMQRLRDEAHRFAISFHRKKRSKAMTASALDDIPGLGPVRRAALLRAFGSLRGLKKASPAELADIPGIGPTTAQTIWQALHPSNA